MAFIHGKGTVITINGNAMSAYSNKVTFNRQADMHDVTTFGKNSHVYQAGLKDGSATIEGIYDNTGAVGPRAVFEPLVGAAAVTLIYRPEGTTTGRPNASVLVLVKSYKQEDSVDDMISWTADLQLSDDITDSTQ